MVNLQRLFKIKKLWHMSKKVWGIPTLHHASDCTLIYVKLISTHNHTCMCVYILSILFSLQDLMRRVKMSRGRQAAGQPVSSSMRWTTWMGSSTLTAWTARPSSTSTGRPLTSRGNGPLPPQKESCKTVVISSSARLGNYIVLCKSFMSLSHLCHQST